MSDAKKEWLAANKKMINHCEKQIAWAKSEREVVRETIKEARREIWRLRFRLLYLQIRRLFGFTT